MATILAALSDMAGARISLASAQAAEEVERHKHTLMLQAVFVAFACSAALLATLLVAVAFWDTQRVAALAALALVHFACSAVAYASLRKRAAMRAREKRLLIMRSTLARLRVQVAAERIARSPAMAIAGSLLRLSRGLRGVRATGPTVR
jgi:uncharacterized membrane protein YqjE